MPPFKDEHILIIAPGSQTTLAQLGLPESFTPARFRFPTRMFPAEKKGEFEPYKVRAKTILVKRNVKPPTTAANTTSITTTTTTTITTSTSDAPPAAETTNGADQKENKDAEMKDVADGEETKPKPEDQVPETIEEEQIVYEEDPTSDEGAIYPIRNGAIVDWPCFLALLTHIYNTLSPPFHTPIMLIAEPVWTIRDRETITQFVFEKFKTPAFCLMDSALAVCYAYGTANATVIDVGHGKADVTAVTDFIANDYGRGLALQGCGGEAMTDRLMELLGPKGFTRDMCEQLKRSNICEILPAGTPLPGGTFTTSQFPNAAGGSTSTTLQSDTPNPSVPGRGPEMSKVTDNTEEDEGVLDVAAIVSSGNTSEYLARREKEKNERATAKKASGAGESGSSKPVRLPNSKKEQASFQYQEYVRLEPKEGDMSTATAQYVQRKRDVEVGVERFLALTHSEEKANDRCGLSISDTLAAQIHHTILSVADTSKRSELWDSLIILGNGSKIKGFTQSLLHTLSQKYILSPSSGTIFTSELPSALSTPLPTGGTTTPANPSNPGPMYHPAAHGVNPLLVAATHANTPTPNHHHLNTNMPGGVSGMDHAQQHHHRTGHSQTPTSLKTLKPPEYFPEWKDQASRSTAPPGAPTTSSSSSSSAPAAAGATTTSSSASGAAAPQATATNDPAAGATGPATSTGVGMEEATFLGAQVAAKVIFVLDQGLSKGFLSRVDYNEHGPTAIFDCLM
ncbi:hypothetical protein AJ80_02936 [Polytolypa hystricis UAMH7299]|uniref:Actin-like protein arp9 n=1 Tax=Polytolypa hystricis (strain UAMH7299) TaxID=1447883 RepID=A0A2B7YPN8_POLH7|nr:hypothetical protein AJ80_02936 [Polytolypa hystricis UAMH7299]